MASRISDKTLRTRGLKTPLSRCSNLSRLWCYDTAYRITYVMFTTALSPISNPCGGNIFGVAVLSISLLILCVSSPSQTYRPQLPTTVFLPLIVSMRSRKRQFLYSPSDCADITFSKVPPE